MRFLGFSLKEQGTKLIESAPDKPYPALWSIWGKTNLSGVDFAPERDDLLAESIKRYILKSDRLMYDIESKLRTVLTKYPQVIVWGTGQLAMKLLAETLLASAQIIAFVDGNPVNQGQILRGVPILAPEEIGDLKHPIIVASNLHQQAIVYRIRQLDLSNKVILLFEEL